MSGEDPRSRERVEMVRQDIRRRGIEDPRVLQAMTAVPRHRFVPGHSTLYAYHDRPLLIGEGQTISQPYIVALMSEALELRGGERTLEVGTGSGYQTAILAELCEQVWTIERSETLSLHAQQVLQGLGYETIRFRIGDGTLGWPTAAPFDRILTTGSLPSVPRVLVNQLVSNGGILVGPVGSTLDQDLIRVRRVSGKLQTERLEACRFVPLIGRWGWTKEQAEGGAT